MNAAAPTGQLDGAPVMADAHMIERLVRARHCDVTQIVSVRRQPSRWSTSRVLYEVDVELSGGSTIPLMVKHAGRAGLTGVARRVRPSFLVDDDREIEMYRSVLQQAALGTAAYYGVIEGGPGDRWLVTERIQGREIHEIGDRDVWEGAAGWLARFHARFAGRPLPGRAARRLISYDRRYMSIWPQRATRFLGPSRRSRLIPILDRYGRVLDAICAQPRTLVHGEFYSSNVMVGTRAGGYRIRVVDWETAGIGPALLDLAALTSGEWPEPERRSLAAAYHAASPPNLWASFDDLLLGLDLCRIHVAIQWLGWAAAWEPPARNATDWLDVAVRAAERIGL